MSNLLEQMPASSLEAFINAMNREDRKELHKILLHLHRSEQGDTSTIFVVYAGNQPCYLGNNVSEALNAFNDHSLELLLALAQAPRYPYELVFFAVSADNDVEVLGTAGINPEQSKSEPLSSFIPDDVCGLCYHPKTDANTCNRDDCPKWQREGVQS